MRRFWRPRGPRGECSWGRFAARAGGADLRSASAQAFLDRLASTGISSDQRIAAGEEASLGGVKAPLDAREIRGPQTTRSDRQRGGQAARDEHEHTRASCLPASCNHPLHGWRHLPNALRVCCRDGRAAPGTVSSSRLLGGPSWKKVSVAGRKRARVEAGFPVKSRRVSRFPLCAPKVAPPVFVDRWSRRRWCVVQRETRGGGAQGRRGSGGQEARAATAARNGSPRGPGVLTDRDASGWRASDGPKARLESRDGSPTYGPKARL
jgi:hypothetical protein